MNLGEQLSSRGVHLHKFTGEDSGTRSKVVYTFQD